MVMPALSICGVEDPWTNMKDTKMDTCMDTSMSTGYYTSMSPNQPHGAQVPNHIAMTTTQGQLSCHGGNTMIGPHTQNSDFNSNLHHHGDNNGLNCNHSNCVKIERDSNMTVMCKDTGSRHPCSQDMAEATKIPTSQTGRELCCGCGQPIQERYLLRVVDNYFHEKCLRCALCRHSLTSSCFVKDGQLLCKNDYSRFYGAKCSGCFQSIPANEFIMRALDHIYHLQCFVCILCGYQLQKGDQFVVKEGRVYCRLDYEKEYLYRGYHPEGDWYPFLPTGSDPDSGDDMDGDSQKGPKRPRTILTTSQRRKFKASFEVNPKPCRKVREALAAETGLSVRVVQVWFQNQRAKMKKIARKQQQNKESQNGSKKSSQKDDKDDSDSDCDSEPSGSKTPTKHLEGTDLTNSDSNPGPATAGVQGLEDVFMNQASQQCGVGGNGATLPPNNGNGHNIVNPIDKLYSMQNSYFAAD